MLSGSWKVCLACGREISEFEDQSKLMECPNATDYIDVVKNLMPSYPSREKCEQTMNILQEGGYNMISSLHRDGEHRPIIDTIRNLATQLMKYEAVDGARFHESEIVCGDCVKKQSKCNSCEHEHAPTCPICKAELVPMN